MSTMSLSNRIRMMSGIGLILPVPILLVACAQGGASLDGDPALCDFGKCDMLNEYNDPANLGYTIAYELADESLVGVNLRSDLVPYSPPTYFPFTSDGINNRRDFASPAEKYDMAFSDWEPSEGFFDLDRITSTSDTGFDQAYYDGLGPVATWEHFEHGLGRLHDGVDNDGDDEIDSDDGDNEGLEGWFGYCNGNTAASLSVPRPLHNATVDDVEFTPYDIMALLAAVYYGDRSTVAGLRCNALRPEQDEYGRYVDQSWYRVTEDDEVEAGQEGELVLFDILQGPFYYDETRETVGYVVGLTESEGQRAIIRLSMDEFTRYGADVKVGEVTFDQVTFRPIEFSVVGRGCRDTNPATLYLAVTHLLGRYRIPFGIDADAGSHVWNYPIYEAIINEQREIEKPEANTLLGVDAEVDYQFNDQAKRFAYVKLTLLRSHQVNLEMVLELDADGRVIGGEWVGRSRTSHPDFVWVPMGADQTGYNTEGTYMTFGDDQLDGEQAGGEVVYNDAPDMRYSDVRHLLQASRTEEGETFERHDGQSASVPVGRTAELAVNVEGEGRVVSEAVVYVDVEADFTPGLKITVVSPSGVEVNIFDIPYQSNEWGPGRFPTGWDLGVVRGVAHPMPLVDDEAGELYPGLSLFEGEDAKGDWTLRVTNEQGGFAQVNGWSLWLTTAAIPE